MLYLLLKYSWNTAYLTPAVLQECCYILVCVDGRKVQVLRWELLISIQLFFKTSISLKLIYLLCYKRCRATKPQTRLIQSYLTGSASLKMCIRSLQNKQVYLVIR